MGMLYPNIQILFRKYQRKVDKIYEISESATLNLIYDIRAAAAAAAAETFGCSV